jgi:hypothetical protein
MAQAAAASASPAAPVAPPSAPASLVPKPAFGEGVPLPPKALILRFASNDDLQQNHMISQDIQAMRTYLTTSLSFQCTVLSGSESKPSAILPLIIELFDDKEKKAEEKKSETTQNKRLTVLVLVGVVRSSGIFCIGQHDYVSPKFVFDAWEKSNSKQNGGELVIFISSPTDATVWMTMLRDYVKDPTISIQISGRGVRNGPFLTAWIAYAQGNFRADRVLCQPGEMTALYQLQDQAILPKRRELHTRVSIVVKSPLPLTFFNLDRQQNKKKFHAAIIGSGSPALGSSVCGPCSEITTYFNECGGQCDETAFDKLDEKKGQAAICELFAQTKFTDHVLVYFGKSQRHHVAGEFDSGSSMPFAWLLEKWTTSEAYKQGGRLCLILGTSFSGQWVSDALAQNKELRLCIQACTAKDQTDISGANFISSLIRYFGGFVQAQDLALFLPGNQQCAYAEPLGQSGPGKPCDFLKATDFPVLFDSGDYFQLLSPDTLYQIRMQGLLLVQNCDKLQGLRIPNAYVSGLLETLQLLNGHLKPATIPAFYCGHKECKARLEFTQAVFNSRKTGEPIVCWCDSDKCGKQNTEPREGYLHCFNCNDWDICHRCWMTAGSPPKKEEK